MVNVATSSTVSLGPNTFSYNNNNNDNRNIRVLNKTLNMPLEIKELSVQLCDIRKYPSEEILSLKGNYSFFSKVFGEPKVILKRCSLEKAQEAHGVLLKKHKELSSELQVAKNYFEHPQTELTSQRDTAQLLKSTVRSINAENRMMEKQQRETQEQLSAYQIEISQLKLQLQNEQLKVAENIDHKQISDLKYQLQQLTSENEKVNQTLSALVEAFQQLKMKCKHLLEDKRELNASVAKLQKAVTETTTKLNKALKEIEDMKIKHKVEVLELKKDRESTSELNALLQETRKDKENADLQEQPALNQSEAAYYKEQLQEENMVLELQNDCEAEATSELNTLLQETQKDKDKVIDLQEQPAISQSEAAAYKDQHQQLQEENMVLELQNDCEAEATSELNTLLQESQKDKDKVMDLQEQPAVSQSEAAAYKDQHQQRQEENMLYEEDRMEEDDSDFGKKTSRDTKSNEETQNRINFRKRPLRHAKSMVRLAEPSKATSSVHSSSDVDSESEEETTKDGSSSDEDYVPDRWEYSRQQRRKYYKPSQKHLSKKKKESSESSESDEDLDTGRTELSAYEKMIEEKRAERMAFLKSLQIDEAKEEFSTAVKSMKKQKQYVKSVQRKILLPSEPLRRSSRIVGRSIACDFSEDPLCKKGISESNKIKPHIQKPRKLPFKETIFGQESYENFCKDFDFQTPETEFEPFSYDRSVVENLTLDKCNIARVTWSGITAVDWHPAPENLIFAAGDKQGNVGIWKVNSESTPYMLLKPHSQGITNLMFNPYNANHLVSSSYEGKLLSGDMVKHVFEEIYKSDDSYTFFDVLSESTYLVAERNGQIAVIDNRAERRSQKKHTCHDCSISVVRVNPLHSEIFLTAGKNGSICLWDLRKLQEKPLADIRYHKRSIQSASFSPVTGNYILATSCDHTISIFDCARVEDYVKLKRSMRPENYKEGDIPVARWLPNSEEAFVTGYSSIQNPGVKRIELYYSDMRVYHIIQHENMSSTTHLNIFHPARPALAGSDDNGRVYIFTPSG